MNDTDNGEFERVFMPRMSLDDVAVVVVVVVVEGCEQKVEMWKILAVKCLS